MSELNQKLAGIGTIIAVIFALGFALMIHTAFDAGLKERQYFYNNETLEMLNVANTGNNTFVVVDYGSSKYWQTVWHLENGTWEKGYNNKTIQSTGETKTVIYDHFEFNLIFYEETN